MERDSALIAGLMNKEKDMDAAIPSLATLDMIGLPMPPSHASVSVAASISLSHWEEDDLGEAVMTSALVVANTSTAVKIETHREKAARRRDIGKFSTCPPPPVSPVSEPASPSPSTISHIQSSAIQTPNNVKKRPRAISSPDGTASEAQQQASGSSPVAAAAVSVSVADVTTPHNSNQMKQPAGIKLGPTSHSGEEQGEGTDKKRRRKGSKASRRDDIDDIFGNM
jgi:hypothetical protein